MLFNNKCQDNKLIIHVNIHTIYMYSLIGIRNIILLTKGIMAKLTSQLPPCFLYSSSMSCVGNNSDRCTYLMQQIAWFLLKMH